MLHASSKKQGVGQDRFALSVCQLSKDLGSNGGVEGELQLVQADNANTLSELNALVAILGSGVEIDIEKQDLPLSALSSLE